ncbi:hypothetical protein niasHT_007071 [Heterodera trifolii]|uniref:Uncharacterized protein n=1 Tax=Heterodera trifolii TaxID=157864 RepID=A0ABD2LXI1_9BILA
MDGREAAEELALALMQQPCHPITHPTPIQRRRQPRGKKRGEGTNGMANRMNNNYVEKIGEKAGGSAVLPMPDQPTDRPIPNKGTPPPIHSFILLMPNGDGALPSPFIHSFFADVSEER